MVQENTPLSLRVGGGDWINPISHNTSLFRKDEYGNNLIDLFKGKSPTDVLIEDSVELLDQKIDEFFPNYPLYLHGQSYGAWFSLLYAAANGENNVKGILAESPVTRLYHSICKRPHYFVAGHIVAYINDALQYFGRDKLSIGEDNPKHALRTDHSYINSLKSPKNDILAKAHSVTCPVAIVMEFHDRVSDIEETYKLAKALPNKHLDLIVTFNDLKLAHEMCEEGLNEGWITLHEVPPINRTLEHRLSSDYPSIIRQSAERMEMPIFDEVSNSAVSDILDEKFYNRSS